MDGRVRIVNEDVQPEITSIKLGLDGSGEYVVLTFEKAISWSALSPEQAVEMARQLQRWARMAQEIRCHHEQARSN